MKKTPESEKTPGMRERERERERESADVEQPAVRLA